MKGNQNNHALLLFMHLLKLFEKNLKVVQDRCKPLVDTLFIPIVEG